jgi:hypothetical protein
MSLPKLRLKTVDSMIDEYIHCKTEDVYHNEDENTKLGDLINSMSKLGSIRRIVVPSLDELVYSVTETSITIEMDILCTIKIGDKITYKKRTNDLNTNGLYRLGGTVVKVGKKTGSLYGPYMMIKQNFRVSIHKLKPILVMLKNIDMLFMDN